MRLNKRSSRVIATGIAAAGLLALGTALPATAATTTDKASPSEARDLIKDLGADATGGSYLDSSNTTVVNVTTKAAADKVRDSGAKPRMVSYSTKQLGSVKSALDESKLMTGTSWSIDPVSNRVAVTTDASVTGDKLTTVKSKVAKYGEKVELRKTEGTYSAKITGGETIQGGGGTCSLGFNVVYGDDADKHAFVTAGHCGNEIQSWTDKGGTALGDTTDSQFPGDDYAIVDYAEDYTDYPSAVGDQTIDAAGTPEVGEEVTRTGQTTGTNEGEVTALDATVEYPEGTVEGMIQTTVCAEPGDSGGPLYSGSTAYGLTSGGSGDCSAGGETFFQPVEEALEAYGVQPG